jgi:serine/threonine protein kinase
MEQLAAGTAFGPYTIEGFIAGGGMGQVYAATNQVYGSAVAVKVLHEKYHVDEGWRLRFNLEGVIGQQLKHPNILSARELVEHDGRVGLVMDLMRDCQTLEQVIGREFRGGLPPAVAMRVFLSVLQGVEYAHERNVVHGDIKPENVLVSGVFEKPDTWDLRVTDFGTVGLIAHPVIIDGRSAVVATPRYASPEHLYGVDHLERRSDIYAMGLLLHFLLTGRHASTARNVKEAAERVMRPMPLVNLVDLPDAVISVFQTCTAVERDARFSTCRDLALAVREVLDGMGEEIQLEDLSADLATEVMDERVEMKKKLQDKGSSEADSVPDSPESTTPFVDDFAQDPETEDEEATELLSGAELQALLAKIDVDNEPVAEPEVEPGVEPEVVSEAESVAEPEPPAPSESGPVLASVRDEHDTLPSVDAEPTQSSEPDVIATEDVGEASEIPSEAFRDDTFVLGTDELQRPDDVPVYVWVAVGVAVVVFAVVCGFGISG